MSYDIWGGFEGTEFIGVYRDGVELEEEYEFGEERFGKIGNDQRLMI